MIDIEKNEMIPLTSKQKSHKGAKVCYICRKYFIKKLFRDINHRKVRDHCHYTGKYKGATNYFENQFECIGKNNKKYKIFSVQIKKEIVKIDKEGNMTVEIIS